MEGRCRGEGEGGYNTTGVLLLLVRAPRDSLTECPLATYSVVNGAAAAGAGRTLDTFGLLLVLLRGVGNAFIVWGYPRAGVA